MKPILEYDTFTNLWQDLSMLTAEISPDALNAERDLVFKSKTRLIRATIRTSFGKPTCFSVNEWMGDEEGKLITRLCPRQRYSNEEKKYVEVGRLSMIGYSEHPPNLYLTEIKQIPVIARMRIEKGLRLINSRQISAT